MEMKTILFAMVMLFGSSAHSQNPAQTGSSTSDQQQNAANATKDNSGTSGDQVTKPVGVKGTTITGCLEKGDAEGHYLFINMQHRTGVLVLGPDDLQNALGDKVKLTGKWEPLPDGIAADKPGKPARRFQATQVEVVSQHCPPPSPVTPTSKNKQQR
jgi:hypothetical protein